MKIKILDLKHLDDSFSVSRLEVLGDQFYFILGDGKEILITDNKWKTPQSFPVKQLAESGLAKSMATVLVRDGKHAAILLVGADNQESKLYGLKINLKSRLAEAINLDVFHDRLVQAGIGELNIRSATIINDKIILCNGSNELEPSGTLLVTDVDFWKKQATADFTLTHIQWDKQTDAASPAVEVSSIFYSYPNDILILAGNTAISEGENERGLEKETIMGVVEHAYRKIDRKRIKVNELFNLGKSNEVFQNCTVITMGAEDDKGNKVKVHMIARNGDGSDSLIKLRLKVN